MKDRPLPPPPGVAIHDSKASIYQVTERHAFGDKLVPLRHSLCGHADVHVYRHYAGGPSHTGYGQIITGKQITLMWW